jgi:DNA-binding PadR family transcriptional regulator
MPRQRSRHPAHRGRHGMRGGRGHGRGRHRDRRGDVRSAILALLDDRPMHGYEMIQELEERTGGRWRPSAGSIYPTLQLLEDEGLVTAEEVEGRKVYSLTDSGKEAAPARTGEARPWEEGDEDSPRFAVRSELMRTAGAAKQIARGDDDEQMTKAAEILKETRRKLYGILAEE